MNAERRSEARRRRRRRGLAPAPVRRRSVAEVAARLRQPEEPCARSIWPGRYEIEIIDLVEHPSLARSDDILAIPTLVRRLPEPLRKIIGDLSDTERVLVGLRLQADVEPMTGRTTRRSNGSRLRSPTVEDVVYELTLFVSGASDLSARAIANARRLCDVHLRGRYHLSVVDVHEDPAAVLEQPGAGRADAGQEPAAAGAQVLVGDLSQHRQGARRRSGLPRGRRRSTVTG